MTAAALSLLTAATTEEHVDIHVPAIVYGLVVFAVLMLLLLATLAFGKGRS
jgi:hypothetical protein